MAACRKAIRARAFPWCACLVVRPLWPFCDARAFPGWGSDLSAACMSFRVGLCLLGNHVPKRGNLAEICGCERLSGFFFVESTDSGDITPGQIFRSRSRSQNHRSQPKISAIFLRKATKYEVCFRIRSPCRRAAVPPCRRAAVPPCRRAAVPPCLAFFCSFRDSAATLRLSARGLGIIAYGNNRYGKERVRGTKHTAHAARFLADQRNRRGRALDAGLMGPARRQFG